MSVGGAQEVMLMVKVAEIQRSAMKKLNVQFAALSNSGQWVVGGVNGGATFPNAVFLPQNANVPIFGNGTHAGGNPIGPMYNQFQPNTPSIENQGLFFSYLSKEFSAAMYLDVAQQQGMAKILAEPNVTTLTGQEATFLSGGSFPIPVPEQNGTIGVQYKDFGVKLIFQPLILESGRINLKLNISVSQLASVNSLVITPITSSSVFAVPALTERSAVSTVELSDGQTIGIAGLMNENMNNAVNKFPGLGDIPILGTLFRSQGFQKGDTELVIFVTPRLAKPIEPGNIRLPTDNVHEPSNLDFYLNGKVESTVPQGPPPAATPSSP
jgi:pilus assembly protein CpaC